MTNKLDIINSARVSLGVAAVQDLAETAQSKAVNSFWDITLRSHPWNFAIKRGVLAASTTAPAFGYTKQFPLPADCHHDRGRVWY